MKESRIQLMRMKLDILKMKAVNGEYDWSLVSKELKDQLEDMLSDINKALEEA